MHDALRQHLIDTFLGGRPFPLAFSHPVLGVPCIYKIFNETTGDCYVGATNDLNRRLSGHRTSLANKSHTSRFQDSFNTYGLKGFTVQILEPCGVDCLPEREAHWVSVLNPTLNSKDEYGHSGRATVCGKGKRCQSLNGRRRNTASPLRSPPEQTLSAFGLWAARYISPTTGAPHYLLCDTEKAAGEVVRGWRSFYGPGAAVVRVEVRELQAQAIVTSDAAGKAEGEAA